MAISSGNLPGCTVLRISGLGDVLQHIVFSVTFKTSQASPTEKQGTELQNANTSAYLEALFQLKQTSPSQRQSVGAFIKVYHPLVVILS